MRINFNKIHIHHFLSFDDAIINLKDKGYCLVKGVNKNPKDAAKSNGSGKSSIWNAISYALTGQTISGLKNNLGNIYFNDGCWVEIEFNVDKDNYILIRSKDDKEKGTNLKIFVNREDKSGKGIRESQAVLDSYLPDLTSELIGSVIILGQGLPQKFTSNSPVGRKEVLEHLSKSDFMIKDVKDRIDLRLTELNNKNREYEDKLISVSSKRIVYSNQLEEAKLRLDNLNKEVNYDEKINYLKEEINKYNNNLKTTEHELEELRKEKDNLNASLLTSTNNKNRRIDTLNEDYRKYDKVYSNYKVELQSNIRQLSKEITDIKNIKDVCPTCGRPFENIVKPDTTEKEKELEKLNKDLENVNANICDNDTQYKEALDEIDKLFEQESFETQSNLTKVNNKIHLLETSIRDWNQNILEKNKSLTNLESEKLSIEKNRKEQIDLVNKLESNIKEHLIEEENLNKEKATLQSHINVVNKMKTLVQRDFRGVLLKNVIDYINERAKSYCSKIFNTDEIEFKLDGTAIDIVFCNKDYENLSGGEKQRVDLITQFSIRDMMCKYLDFNSNILVLDEITDALDSVSCDKVINFITQELNDIESVFIISHHSDELEIPYDCEIVVQKNELGISEVI